MKSPALTRTKQRGVTLIEVLFAIFLIAAGLAVIVAAMPIADVSRIKADYRNKATGLAQKQLEAIRGLGYPNLTPTQLNYYGLIDSTTTVATNTYTFTNVDSANLDNPARILPSGTGRVTIEQLDLDLRRVTIQVSWTERGASKSVRIGTLVANL